MTQLEWLRIVFSAEINVYVWRYALLAVHVRKEEGLSTKDNRTIHLKKPIQ